MSWIALVAWLAAIVIAAVVLALCTYQLRWRSRRLRADLGELRQLGTQLSALRADVLAAQQRARAVRAVRAGPG